MAQGHERKLFAYFLNLVVPVLRRNNMHTHRPSVLLNTRSHFSNGIVSGSVTSGDSLRDRHPMVVCSGGCCCTVYMQAHVQRKSFV